MTIRFASSGALVLAALAFAPPAFADAGALKHAADEAYDARRFDEAARSYEAAWNEKHDPSLLYNLARTYESLGRHPEALDRLQRFADTAPFELRKRVPRLDGMLAVFRTRVSTLLVESNVAGARVIVRNTIVGQTTVPTSPIKVNAGPAAVEITKEGYRPWAKELTLDGGVETKLEAMLDKKEDYEAPRLPPDARTEPAAPVYTRWWFWTATGAAALVLTTIVLYVAVSTEGPPPVGNLGAGTVSAPLVSF